MKWLYFSGFRCSLYPEYSNASTIVSSIKVALQLMELSKPIEAMLRLSRDPIKGFSAFIDLLSTVSADVKKANQEIAARMQHKLDKDGDSSQPEYNDEREKIEQSKEIIEEVKKNYVN